jgi:acetoacetate decarboxylase
VLRHRSFTVTLHGNAFGDGPYRVTTRSTLNLTLRRTKVTTQILPFVARSH